MTDKPYADTSIEENAFIWANIPEELTPTVRYLVTDAYMAGMLKMAHRAVEGNLDIMEHQDELLRGAK